MSYSAETRVFAVDPAYPDPAIIQQAAEVLRAGGLVAFPTETVYGLGANATDADAVSRIFIAKGRPANDPLIVHIASIEQLEIIAYPPPDTDIGKWLTQLWPGPLTLILKRREIIPSTVSAGLDTVAVRIPNHPVAQALLKMANLPIAAPSANTFSRPSATTAQHVLEDLNGRVDVVLDGGATPIGIESTIIDVTVEPPCILRYGAIESPYFEALGFTHKLHHMTINTDEDGVAKPAPGMMVKHYSPKAKLLFYGGPLDFAKNFPYSEVIRRMQSDVKSLIDQGKQVGILTPDEEREHFEGMLVKIASLGSREKLDEIAAHLFAAMRDLDKQGVDVILARGYPRFGVGAAIWDRLVRAAEGRIINASEHVKLNIFYL